MDTRLDLLQNASWEQIATRLISFADRQIRQHIWRGEPACSITGQTALADGKDAEDYAHEAIRSLLDTSSGRNWDHVKNPDILSYLMSTVKSMISNASRRVENRDTRRHLTVKNDNPDEIDDAFDRIPDTRQNHVERLESDERVAAQKEVLDELKRTTSGDRELSLLLEALENEIVKNKDIEELTGIPAARVSELKRKLSDRLERIQPKRTQTCLRGI